MRYKVAGLNQRRPQPYARIRSSYAAIVTFSHRVSICYVTHGLFYTVHGSVGHVGPTTNGAPFYL